MLTQHIINEFATLLATEDQTIWDVGDKINKYELGREDIAELADEVDRSVSTLWARARLAAMFPADMWERSSAPIGVWEQLSRLDTPAQRHRLLRKKAWTVNALRKEIDQMLMERDLPLPPTSTSVRVTRFNLAGMRIAMKSVLTPDGVLSLTLPAPVASGTKLVAEADADGNIQLKIPLDVNSLEDLNDPRHLKVVR